MTRQSPLVAAAILACALGASCATGSPEGFWPQWRGAQRDNVSTETGLLQAWPPEGPPLSWEVDGIGTGISGIAVSGRRIFAMGFDQDLEYLTALEEETGKRLWTAAIGTKRGFSDNPLMRWLKQRAPTVDDDRVYAFSGDGQLVCLEVREGRERWRKSYTFDLGGRQTSFGSCDYPLVDGERLVCVVGGPRPAMVALDKKSGDMIWRSATPEARGEGGFSGEWAATVVTEGGGVRQYVAMMRHGMFGFRALDGKILWSYDKLSDGGFPYHRTPVVMRDHLLAFNANGARMACLKLVPEEDGVQLEEKYRTHKIRVPFLQDSALVVDGFLYSMIGNQVSCFRASNGEQAWSQSLGEGRGGSFTYAEGHLYIHDQDGTVTLASVSPERMTLKGVFKTRGRSNTSGATIPVVAGRKLYVRDESRLSCFDVRKGSPAQLNPRRILLLPPERPPASGPSIPPYPEFVATPQDIVMTMLHMAGVRKQDTVYDLGSGDGRIVMAAARERGARGVGFEIDGELVRVSRTKVEQAGLEELVRIEQKDLYTVDLSPANVVAVYLPEPFLEKLIPQLERLAPGSRIVSHQFKIPGCVPDQSLSVVSSEDQNPHAIHLWRVPLQKDKR